MEFVAESSSAPAHGPRASYPACKSSRSDVTSAKPTRPPPLTLMRSRLKRMSGEFLMRARLSQRLSWEPTDTKRTDSSASEAHWHVDASPEAHEPIHGKEEPTEEPSDLVSFKSKKPSLRRERSRSDAELNDYMSRLWSNS